MVVDLPVVETRFPPPKLSYLWVSLMKALSCCCLKESDCCTCFKSKDRAWLSYLSQSFCLALIYAFILSFLARSYMCSYASLSLK